MQAIGAATMVEQHHLDMQLHVDNYKRWENVPLISYSDHYVTFFRLRDLVYNIQKSVNSIIADIIMPESPLARTSDAQSI